MDGAEKMKPEHERFWRNRKALAMLDRWMAEDESDPDADERWADYEKLNIESNARVTIKGHLNAGDTVRIEDFDTIVDEIYGTENQDEDEDEHPARNGIGPLRYTIREWAAMSQEEQWAELVQVWEELERMERNPQKGAE